MRDDQTLSNRLARVAASAAAHAPELWEVTEALEYDAAAPTEPPRAKCKPMVVGVDGYGVDPTATTAAEVWFPTAPRDADGEYFPLPYFRVGQRAWVVYNARTKRREFVEGEREYSFYGTVGAGDTVLVGEVAVPVAPVPGTTMLAVDTAGVELRWRPNEGVWWIVGDSQISATANAIAGIRMTDTHIQVRLLPVVSAGDASDWIDTTIGVDDECPQLE